MRSCNCPIEIRFDDNDFVEIKEVVVYTSSLDIENDETTYSGIRTVTHPYKHIYNIEVTRCCNGCNVENERLNNIEYIKEGGEKV